MFQKRYVTKGVSVEIPIFMQNLMFYMIESMEVDKKDYLQIFELKKVIANGSIFQEVIHRQEQPEYKKIIQIPVNEKIAVNKKVYVIDSISYCMMLLAEEY